MEEVRVKMGKDTYISVKDVEYIYRDYFEDVGIKFSKRDFKKFLDFLEIDFHDWVKSNLRYFDKE